MSEIQRSSPSITSLNIRPVTSIPNPKAMPVPLPPRPTTRPTPTIRPAPPPVPLSARSIPTPTFIPAPPPPTIKPGSSIKPPTNNNVSRKHEIRDSLLKQLREQVEILKHSIPEEISVPDFPSSELIKKNIVFPPGCKTCGRRIGCDQKIYENLWRQKFNAVPFGTELPEDFIGQILDEIGIVRECCRARILGIIPTPYGSQNPMEVECLPGSADVYSRFSRIAIHPPTDAVITFPLEDIRNQISDVQYENLPAVVSIKAYPVGESVPKGKLELGNLADIGDSSILDPSKITTSTDIPLLGQGMLSQRVSLQPFTQQMSEPKRPSALPFRRYKAV